MFAIDAAESWGCQARGAAAEEMVHVDIDEEATMVRIDHVIEGECATADGIQGNGLGGEDVVDASALFTSRDFGVRPMAVDQDVNQVMAMDEGVEFPVVLRVA
jgi:hypothetical protein